MSYVIKDLPDLEQLKLELQDPSRLKIYRRYGCFTGDLESIQYLQEKIQVVLEQENTYIEERFMG